MSKIKDITGQRFGRLVVMEFSHMRKKAAHWICTCDCGNTCLCNGSTLRRGNKISCGCFQREVTGARNRTHGYSQHPLYKIWCNMKNKCYNKHTSDYKHYGARGITVHKAWKRDPAAFIEWAFTNGYDPSLELDRRDNDKGYSPGNCHFISHIQNIQNQRLMRRTNTTGYRGVTQTGKNYKAQQTINGTYHYLGRFDDPKEAAIFRDKFVAKRSDIIPLNFPELGGRI